MARWDEDKEAFIRNLIQVNLRAGVEPELVDLLAAYARIRLQQGDKVTFYSEDADLPGSRRKAVRALLEANRHLDPRALSFLSTYAEAMVQRGLIPILTRTHLAKLFRGLRKRALGSRHLYRQILRRLLHPQSKRPEAKDPSPKTSAQGDPAANRGTAGAGQAPSRRPRLQGESAPS
ncbi:MAG: hypothetical protein M5R38_15260 [Candidatus Methylomirabilis sp.]|nr:hypothetical protein [Candidatus Methylomirabilis sp.]